MEEIRLGQTEVKYHLKKSHRKTLGMKVDSQGQLHVTAPHFVPLFKIEEILKTKGDWILKKIEENKTKWSDRRELKFPEGAEARQFARMVSILFQKCLLEFNQTMQTDFRPTLSLRKMRSRWGSCSIDGRIHLSYSLFSLDPELIGYVIFHELSHLIHHNHSAYFYNVLEAVCPKHKELKRELHSKALFYAE